VRHPLLALVACTWSGPLCSWARTRAEHQESKDKDKTCSTSSNAGPEAAIGDSTRAAR